MLDYWLRMASGAFFLVGMLFLLFTLRPRRFAAVIPWMGWLMIAEGLILLVSGLRLRLPPAPFYFDTSACLLLGTGLVALRKAALEAPC